MTLRTASHGPALVAGLLIALATPVPAQDGPGLQAFRSQALEQVNRARAERGLSALRPGRILNRIAQSHAEDMRARGYYAHSGRSGDGPRERFLGAGGGRRDLVAENIMQCRGCGPLSAARIAEFHAGWMNSSGHRANILHKGLERFGFGVATGGDRIFAVQTFAGAGSAVDRKPRGRAQRRISPTPP